MVCCSVLIVFVNCVCLMSLFVFGLLLLVCVVRCSLFDVCCVLLFVCVRFVVCPLLLRCVVC